MIEKWEELPTASVVRYFSDNSLARHLIEDHGLDVDIKRKKVPDWEILKYRHDNDHMPLDQRSDPLDTPLRRHNH